MKCPICLGKGQFFEDRIDYDVIYTERLVTKMRRGTEGGNVKQIPILIIKPYFTFRRTKLGSSGQASIEFKLVWLRVKEAL